MTPPIRIRPMVASDYNFVMNSFLKRYRDAIRARFISDRDYYALQHEIISKILSQPGLIALVACSSTDENQIFAYCLAEKSHIIPDLLFIHWVYSKGPFRRFGLAKALLNALPEAATVHYTHRTKLVEFLDKEQRAIFNPHYVFALL